MRPRTPVFVAAFLLWTLFTWVGRIRNALSDDALEATERTWAVLLALSFVVPALVLAVAWWRHVGSRWTGRDLPPVGAATRLGTLAFAAWTVGVWVVRAVDIAFFSGHEIGFVVVHTVLAAVAIGLAVVVARSVAGAGTPRRVPHTSKSRAS